MRLLPVAAAGAEPEAQPRYLQRFHLRQSMVRRRQQRQPEHRRVVQVPGEAVRHGEQFHLRQVPRLQLRPTVPPFLRFQLQQQARLHVVQVAAEALPHQRQWQRSFQRRLRAHWQRRCKS